MSFLYSEFSSGYHAYSRKQNKTKNCTMTYKVLLSLITILTALPTCLPHSSLVSFLFLEYTRYMSYWWFNKFAPNLPHTLSVGQEWRFGWAGFSASVSLTDLNQPLELVQDSLPSSLTWSLTGPQGLLVWLPLFLTGCKPEATLCPLPHRPLQYSRVLYQSEQDKKSRERMEARHKLELFIT